MNSLHPSPFPARFRDRIRINAATSVLIAAAVAVGLFRIVACYDVVSQTWDEAVTVATGMEWLDQGTYTYEPLHPPLARVMTAFLPYLAGVRSRNNDSVWDEGNAVLDSKIGYDLTLRLARMGILPCFVILSLVAAYWGYLCGGPSIAVLSVLLFTTIPSVLGHSGVATLDLTCAAFATTAMLMVWRWMEQPTVARGVLAGGTAGLALLAKFSSIVFLSEFVFFILVFRTALFTFRLGNRPSDSADNLLKPIALGAPVVLIALAGVVWGGYRFSVRPLREFHETPSQMQQRDHNRLPNAPAQANGIQSYLYVPAPEFFEGIAELPARNDHGHANFFLGKIQTSGVWYFYPVVLAFKTPIPLILLFAIGLGCLIKEVKSRQINEPLIAAVCGFSAVLMGGILSNVNNGTRQILAFYPMAAILAACGALQLWSLKGKCHQWRIAAFALILWHVAESFGAHPDYIAYFNEFAGNRPEFIAVDSDLDWGQDLNRLVAVLKERRIDRISIAYYGAADLERLGHADWQPLEPWERCTGWVAASVGRLKLGTRAPPYDDYAWLERYTPVQVIGKTILLYEIPEQSTE